jgi:serine protease
MHKIILLSSFLLVFFVLIYPIALRGEAQPDDGLLSADQAARPTDQLIVRFVDDKAANEWLPTRSSRALSPLSAAVGAELTYAYPMSMDAHVLRLPAMTPLDLVEGIAANLSQLEGVLYAEPDRILSLYNSDFPTPYTPELIPNDPRWADMWHLHYTAGTSEGVNMAPAWDISTGSASTVVAVIDTGILPHSDLAGKTMPGYDFITSIPTANDGNGRDPDPSDPGDWITSDESNQVGGYFYGCLVTDSSWHGTHVAGTIGAATNNGVGIAGVNWHAKILPVRVLGKCGGYTSDIIDGMRWSAGLPVGGGIPNNTNPAKVLNLSLGAKGACSTAQQQAVNEIVAAGSIIVAAAGNDNANVANYNPANCQNVIAVAATNRTGNKANYSNFGSLIKISAPGGETHSVITNGVLSTLDSGTQGPTNSNTYASYPGTSMATPHIAGVVSLIVGLRPDYTHSQVLALLQSTARPFPAGSTCNTSNCGAGIVDAYHALSALTFVPTVIYLPAISKPAAASTSPPTD